VFDFRVYTSLFLMILLLELSPVSHELSNDEMVIYGEKMEKHEYKDSNFKIYTDYLIQDPSKYGKKDTSSKTNK
jgi:hypothetical protein